MKYLDLPSGRVPLPAFFPDATYAAVRAASFADVEAAGLFGLTVGTILLLIHLAGLRSLGEAYLAPFSDVGTGGALVRRRYDKRGRGA